MKISPDNIRRLSPSATQRIVDGIVKNQDAIIRGGINTELRVCHFMAQLAHESAHFMVTREFASGAEYEGRISLGNTQPGDGERFRGRGLIQTTGRANYREATDDIRKVVPTAPDFEANPEQLEEFPWALLAGISYWRRRNINYAADQDDILRVTRLVNGGLNGLEERKRYLRIAKAIWIPGSTSEQSSAVARPILRRGSKGPDVTILQNELSEAGFKVFADGDFGEYTEGAVKAFQSRHSLTPDGVVGPRTWGVLTAR
jgi:putative chitinase